MCHLHVIFVHINKKVGLAEHKRKVHRSHVVVLLFYIDFSCFVEACFTGLQPESSDLLVQHCTR